jgi:hypothetical protein
VRRRLVVLVGVVAALVIGAAACGGDDNSGDGADDAPTADNGHGGANGSGDAGGQIEARTVSGGDLLGPADEGIEGVEAFRVDSRTHTEEPLAYDPAPPVGGEHHPVPAICGFYADDPPPDSMLVHDLEHGAIWIAYDPGMDAAELATIRDLVAQQAKVTATPYPGLDTPLVVSAWARQLRLDDPGDPRLVAFVEQYRNGPEAPEPWASCQGAGDPEMVSPAG